MTENSSKNSGEILSPCIRNCCLDKNDMCIGCYRFISEIIGWHDAAENKKREILASCYVRKNNARTR